MSKENKPVKRIKVLYIQVPPGGGSLIALYEMVKHLDVELICPVILCYHKNNYNSILETIPACRVIYIYPEEQIMNDIPNNIKTYSVPVNYIRNQINALREIYFSQRRLISKIREVISNEKPDIVHHNNDINLNAAAVSAAIKSGVVQVMHNRSLYAYKQNEIITWYYKKLLQKIESFINITRAVENHYIKIFQVRKNISTVMHDFVDIKKFTSTILNNCRDKISPSAQNDFVIAVIGRIIKWKGQHILLEAINNIKGELGNFKIWIVGPADKGIGDSEYLTYLKALVVKYNLIDNVFFTGNRNDIAEIMHASDILIHASVKPEPQGLIIIEALLCGKPVIASDSGGSAEIIDKYGGYKIAPGNAKLLGEAILNYYHKWKAGILYSNIKYDKLIKDFLPSDKSNFIINKYRELLCLS